MPVKSKSKRAGKELPIVVIGGGPAGMTAAQTAVKEYKNVVLYDKNPIPGKKLSSIVSDRILIGKKLSPEKTAEAFGAKGKFIMPALRIFGWKEITDHLEKMGLSVGLNGENQLVVSPESAPLVSTSLKKSAESAGVVVKKSSRVTDIEISRGVAKGVVVNGVTHPVSAVVVACGSYSSPNLGSTRDGYEMARKAGHKITPIKPAMVGLETLERYGKILAGVSIRDCRIDVSLDEKLQFTDRGALTFASYGLEGDLILNHSARIIDLLEKGQVTVNIDLMPDKSKSRIEKILGQGLESSNQITVWKILTRYIPDRLLDGMHKMIRIHSRRPAVRLSNLERKSLAIWLKEFAFTIKRCRPFNETRGVLGGVSVDDIDPETMRSKTVKNLYFAGDVLDLLGPCGGYNIEMAFATGHLAGLSAANFNSIKKETTK
ncbi:MAG: aminoacetone oxidase family FAD-binding enzyme, partial [candidate division Zixibacteria bacterium]